MGTGKWTMDNGVGCQNTAVADIRAFHVDANARLNVVAGEGYASHRTTHRFFICHSRYQNSNLPVADDDEPCSDFDAL